MKRMIGLMGNSGAGKSTVASFLMELGADVIDADKISHDICEPGNAGYDAVRKGFGEQFFGADGKLEDVYKRQMVRIAIQRRKANGCSGYRCTTNYHATISIM